MTSSAIQELSASDIAAWWGAAVATIVLFFELFKWQKSRAAISVSAKPNMQIVGRNGVDNRKHIVLTATNRGGQPTTITHVIVAHYPSWFRRLRNRPDMQGAVPDPTPGCLPHVLAPGEIWTGLLDQVDLQEKSEPKGYLYCGVHHSLANEPVMVRVDGI